MKQNILVQFLTSKGFKTFCWQSLNGILGLIVVFLGGLDWYYAPIAISVLNYITKEINKHFLSKYVNL